MSNTLPDITVVQGAWVDAYAASGIPVGTSLIIKNRSSSVMYVYTGPTAPTVDSVVGWDLAVGEWTRVSTVPVGSKVWLLGNGGKAFVQIVD